MLQGFSGGFKNNLKDVNVLFMQSDGGLTQMNRFVKSTCITLDIDSVLLAEAIVNKLE